MFKARCPECNNDVEVINGKCNECNFDIANYMISNGLIEGDKLITDKVFICQNCGKMEASTGRLYLKCSECGTPYKATDIDRKNPIKLINTDERQLIEEYVGDTINWDIYNSREEEWNRIQNERHKYQQQKLAEEQARQDAINHPKCPTCGSTNIRKIGTGERVASVIGFGILSRKINKTWKCNNCGHTW